jgi:hypothetical protein
MSKWAHMTHLDICNTSYGQKKGRESVWLPTTESPESTRFLCVQVACNTLLKSSRLGLQLWFKPHPNRRCAQEVIVPQSCGIPSLGVGWTKSHTDATPVEWCKVYYMGGRWWLPPSPSHGESCEFEVACGLWLFLAPKVLQPCANQLVC